MNNKKEALISVKESLQQNFKNLPQRIQGFLDEVENQILLIELSEKLGSTVPEYSDAIGGYIDLTFGNHKISLIEFNKSVHDREIPCPDEEYNVIDGWYLRFSFSTGAYMFHSGYPKKTFNKFFEHLKSYNPCYTDTMNHTLYFSLDRDREQAQKVYKDYPDLQDKYWLESQEEVLKAEINKASEALEQFKNKRAG